MDCDELVVCLLFPPCDYVSGINVFKRIVGNKKPVDVIQLKSELSDDYFNQYINERIFLDEDCELDTPSCILKSLEKSIGLIRKDYKRIYSRSWIASNHLIALEYKFLNPDVIWRAEFSDPLILNMSNKIRNNKKFSINNSEYVDNLNRHIAELNNKNNAQFPFIDNESSVFFIAEYLTYLFADELVFTNENQRKIMLSQFPKDVEEMALKKSVTEMHPTLDEEYYHLKSAELDLDGEYINMAYFGRDYYGQRHFESLFYSVESLNHKFKDRIRVYLFIEDVALIKKLISPLSSRKCFIVKKPLEYFEFLNAALQFDVLIVNDVITKDVWPYNPYLPSKISDYLGSSRDIWALYENGSALSGLDLKYMSDIDDFSSCRSQLIRILEDYGFGNDEYSVNEDYFQKRLTDLNKLYETEFKKCLKLKNENESLLNLNSKILSSNSWKLTKPLRDIRNKK